MGVFKKRLLTGKGSRGFTLIEVMVAALLLLVAMAGFVPFFLSGLSHASTVRYKSLATNIARERMEQVRGLDYREIGTGAQLAVLFGDTATVSTEERTITFSVLYQVAEEAHEGGILKKVTITVGWTGPPVESVASITTLIHQQFVGPRGALLELIPSGQEDPLGTPFPLISGRTIARYHIAQADWGLVLDKLDQEGMAARNVYMRLAFFDNDRLSYPDEDLRITSLYYTLDAAGKVNDVYFEHEFDASAIPDGYWEMRAVAYNEYDEPGNVWRMRIRVESGPPEQPPQFEAIPAPGDQSVVLVWTGGQERDRAHYMLQRRKFGPEGWPEIWTMVAAGIDPRATTYLDQGEIEVLDPWGTPDSPSLYQYRLWAVDICQPGLAGEPAMAQVALPPSEAPPSVPLPGDPPTTSTTIGVYSGQVVNNSNRTYNFTVKGEDGLVLSSGSIAKRSSFTIGGLAPGNYLFTATTSGRPTITLSFSMPEQKDQILVTIL